MFGFGFRSLVVLGAALVSASAWATPRMGDFALYDAVLSLNGQSMTATLQLELVAQDAEKGALLERQTIQFEGQDAQVSETWKSAEEFMNDETIANVLANCSAAGGTLETIEVPAGRFDTCAVPFDNDQSSGRAWIGKVSFGIVRVDSTNKENGMLVVSKLRQFR